KSARSTATRCCRPLPSPIARAGSSRSRKSMPRGVNGKKLVVVSKDDGGKPADAQTAANELVSSENVVMLIGTFLSNIGLAVSDFANQKKVFFLAAEPLTDAITWAKGNHYTFRLRPSNYMQAAMLVEEAAKLPAK